MIVFICVDEDGGIFFNMRRQSRDSKLIAYIAEQCVDKKLWMSAYSAELFKDCEKLNTELSENFLELAGKGEYCFAENVRLLPFEDKIEELTVFRWNRLYPSDTYFDLPLSEHEWKCIKSEDFEGSSHEKITAEVYKREQEQA